MSVYIGIDIGKSGAIVAIDDEGDILHKYVMPLIASEYDIQKICFILDCITTRDAIVGIEQPIIMPINGAKSSQVAGIGYGLMLGIVAAKGFKYTTIRPVTWTKVIHKDIPGKIPSKCKSAIAFQRMYPGVDLKETARCKNPHDGLIDALLIATYLKKIEGYVI